MITRKCQPPISRAITIMAFLLLLSTSLVNANDDVYYRTLLSTVLVWHTTDLDDGSDGVSLGYGTGWILDYRNGYLVSNEHVVRGKKNVRISFPEFNNGEVITSAEHYLRHASFQTGRVVVVDENRDLALIKVKRIPRYMRSLELAGVPLKKSEEIYTIGNRVSDDRVFIFRKGNVLFEGFGVEQKSDDKQLIANLLYTRSDFIQGNSGGPIVNNEGSLVGIVAAINEVEHYNVNLSKYELQKWLGIYPKDSKMTGQELMGNWVCKITEQLKQLGPDGKPMKRERTVGVNFSYILNGQGSLQVIGHGRMQEYDLKYAVDELTREFLEPNSFNGAFDLFPYKGMSRVQYDPKSCVIAAGTPPGTALLLAPSEVEERKNFQLYSKNANHDWTTAHWSLVRHIPLHCTQGDWIYKLKDNRPLPRRSQLPSVRVQSSSYSQFSSGIQN